MFVPKMSNVFGNSPVAMKPLLRNSIVAGLVPVKFPDDERLVSAGREDHVGVLGVGGDLGHPPIVTPQSPSELQGLGHDNFSRPFLL